MSAFGVPFDLRKLFSTSFRFMKTLYIYIENPPASRGAERVGCRPRRRVGAVVASHPAARRRRRQYTPVPNTPPRRFFFPLLFKGSHPFASAGLSLSRGRCRPPWDIVASARPYRFAGCCRTGGKWCAVIAKVLYHLYYTLCVLQAVKTPPEIIPPPMLSRPICRRRASIRARAFMSNMFYILLFCPKTRNAVFCPISAENTL